VAVNLPLTTRIHDMKRREKNQVHARNQSLPSMDRKLQPANEYRLQLVVSHTQLYCNKKVQLPENTNKLNIFDKTNNAQSTKVLSRAADVNAVLDVILADNRRLLAIYNVTLKHYV